MKILRLGDPHCQVSNLDQMEGLMHFIHERLIGDPTIERLEILGDLLHTHAVIRMEVLNFWDFWLDLLSDTTEVVVLVGNHDLKNSVDLDKHGLSVFHRLKKKNLKIIDYATKMGIFGYMPYMHDKVKFIEEANRIGDLGVKILICHQTFAGSQFENGFYAPDGVNPDDVKIPLIISGHIHARQRFGKIYYPGTAHWMTNSDANQPKGLWLVDHDDSTGAILKEEFIDTSSVCTPIISLEWKEGDNYPEIPEDSRTTVQLVGSSRWVSEQKANLKGKVSIQTKITDKAKLQNRSTGNNLEKFISEHFETKLNRDKLLKHLKDLDA